MHSDLLVRLETPADQAAIRAVHELAFGQGAEAALVDALRENAKLVLSIVAVLGGDVVGHILFTDLLGGSQRLVGLAPMAVLPGHQREGVGGALVREAFGYLREQGYGGVVVLGHPESYPRFGFRPAAEFGIKTQFEAPDEYLFALDLKGDGLKSCVARYQPEFESLP